MSTPSIKRNDALRRSAAVRAQIVAYFNRVNMPRNTSEILSDLEDRFREIGVTDNNQVQVQLEHLARVGQIAKLQATAGKGHPNVYGPSKGGAVAVQAAPVAHAIVPPAIQSQVQLEIVKSNGNVRLGVRGLVIEISVVDR